MKLHALVVSLLLSVGLSWAQKPIQLADILSWKRIQAPAVSNDGEWLAYRVAPAEGDAEVVIRNLETGKEAGAIQSRLPRKERQLPPPPPHYL